MKNEINALNSLNTILSVNNFETIKEEDYEKNLKKGFNYGIVENTSLYDNLDSVMIDTIVKSISKVIISKNSRISEDNALKIARLFLESKNVKNKKDFEDKILKIRDDSKKVSNTKKSKSMKLTPYSR